MSYLVKAVDGGIAWVDEGDVDLLEGLQWSTDSGGYLVDPSGTPVYRRIWEQHNRCLIRGEQIHHINGDRPDCRLANLNVVYDWLHRRITDFLASGRSPEVEDCVFQFNKDGGPGKWYLNVYLRGFGIHVGRFNFREEACDLLQQISIAESTGRLTDPDMPPVVRNFFSLDPLRLRSTGSPGESPVRVLSGEEPARGSHVAAKEASMFLKRNGTEWKIGEMDGYIIRRQSGFVPCGDHAEWENKVIAPAQSTPEMARAIQTAYREGTYTPVGSSRRRTAGQAVSAERPADDEKVVRPRGIRMVCEGRWEARVRNADFRGMPVDRTVGSHYATQAEAIAAMDGFRKGLQIAAELAEKADQYNRSSPPTSTPETGVSEPVPPASLIGRMWQWLQAGTAVVISAAVSHKG